MIWGMTNTQAAQWHRRYAWHPVFLDDGRTIWLEQYHTRLRCNAAGFTYRQTYREPIVDRAPPSGSKPQPT